MVKPSLYCNGTGGKSIYMLTGELFVVLRYKLKPKGVDLTAEHCFLPQGLLQWACGQSYDNTFTDCPDAALCRLCSVDIKWLIDMHKIFVDALLSPCKIQVCSCTGGTKQFPWFGCDSAGDWLLCKGQQISSLEWSEWPVSTITGFTFFNTSSLFQPAYLFKHRALE